MIETNKAMIITGTLIIKVLLDEFGDVIAVIEAVEVVDIVVVEVAVFTIVVVWEVLVFKEVDVCAVVGAEVVVAGKQLPEFPIQFPPIISGVRQVVFPLCGIHSDWAPIEQYPHPEVARQEVQFNAGLLQTLETGQLGVDDVHVPENEEQKFEKLFFAQSPTPEKEQNPQLPLTHEEQFEQVCSQGPFAGHVWPPYQLALRANWLVHNCCPLIVIES